MRWSSSICIENRGVLNNRMFQCLPLMKFFTFDRLSILKNLNRSMESHNDNQTLDDIVFSNRERSYGSFYLRKKYTKYLIVSFSAALLLILIICLSSLYETYRRLHEQQMRPYVLFEQQKNAINELSENYIPPPPPKKQQEDEASIKIVEEEMPDLKKKIEKDDQDTTETKDSLLFQQSIQSTVYGDGNPDLMYYEVEEMPQFPGGLAGLQDYISRNTIYPEEAMRRRISGTVVVRFCIEADGTVTKIGISNAISPILDSVSIRAIRKMPRWRPGKQHGKNIKVWYTMPINFIPMKG
jgi:protein TonB